MNRRNFLRGSAAAAGVAGMSVVPSASAVVGMSAPVIERHDPLEDFDFEAHRFPKGFDKVQLIWIALNAYHESPEVVSKVCFLKKYERQGRKDIVKAAHKRGFIESEIKIGQLNEKLGVKKNSWSNVAYHPSNVYLFRLEPEGTEDLNVFGTERLVLPS